MEGSWTWKSGGKSWQQSGLKRGVLGDGFMFLEIWSEKCHKEGPYNLQGVSLVMGSWTWKSGGKSFIRGGP